MDCPRGWDCCRIERFPLGRLLPGVSCLLLGLTLGCFHWKVEPLPAPMEPPPGSSASVTNEKDLPKRLPLASTCVTLGKGRASTAKDPGCTPAHREFCRDQARRCFQKALEIDPKCRDAYLGLAALYQDMEEYDRALATFQKGLKEFPKDPALWFEMGMCQARCKRWEPALESLRSAAGLDSENRQYQNALGFCLARAGRYEESFTFFQKAQGEAKAHYHLARMLYQTNSDEACKEHLRLALQANPKLAPARELLEHLEKPTPPVKPILSLSLEQLDEAAPH